MYIRSWLLSKIFLVRAEIDRGYYQKINNLLTLIRKTKNDLSDD